LEIFNYLRQPFFIEADAQVKFGKKIKAIFWIFLVYLLFAFCANFILLLIDTLIVTPLYDYSVFQQLKLQTQKNKQVLGPTAFFYVVIFGPFLEEIIFRLPLRLKKYSIGLSFGIITYYVSGGSFKHFMATEWITYVRIVISIIILLSIAKFLPTKRLDLIKTNFFKHYFYIVALVFALIHVANFAPFNMSVLFFYPIFTLPQFIMGLFFGYARMNYGFFVGWGVHTLINLMAFLIN
jgi:membrane protease YdiL (CAAX protease family)